MNEATTLPSLPEPTRGPWGLLPTIGFTLLIAVAYFGSQTLVIIVFAVIETVEAGGDIDPGALEESLLKNGDLMAIATLLCALVCVPLILFLCYLRKPFPVSRYLYLGLPRWWHPFLWVALLYLVFIPEDLARIHWFHGEEIPAFMLDVVGTSTLPVALWLAFVAGAPFVEEFFFRGFLFEGVRSSRLGAIGATLVTALLFAAIHFQYGILELSTVFLGGIFLAAARLHTGSLWTPVIVHAAWNFTAVLQATQALG